MATVKDIARLAGVSPTTVSWALNGKRVSEESLRRVLEAARELNYHPKMSARSLRAGKVFSIGFYIVNPSLDPRLNGYLFPMLAGISKVLAEDNYAMQFDIIMPDKLDLLVKKALEHSVDGMLILPQFQGVTEQLLKDLPDKFPVVYMQQDPGADPEHCVVIDQAAGVDLAIRRLYQLGHRDIGIITGPEEHVDNQLRLAAARRVFADLGLTWREAWVAHGQFDMESGEAGMRRILQANPRPTAVFCFNDYMAIGALRAAAAAGLSVPEDVSILGFDDTDVAEASTPALTTIQQPVFQQGQQAAAMLMQLIKGEAAAAKVERIQPAVIERSSVERRPS
ncbi:LacI family DNA-binding transcriptional regulator [Alicyclobacillus vulcanalis]|uniref:Transcriptional regulator, LacI family n=1 Tax=Alicyclobacillus vulcanalis TaxID=252246 RepID=A0A1N7MBY5_9BACL|nr:LacI family DNA-binding transcriptional regulator [Alicyclobacillus vulcanalis]SIS83655.1 transcriptional regulator, LacI family [Alicyclobacillus vulcanalis]